MGIRVDPQFLTEVKKYGAVNVENCFNCGNCTAICPLSTNSETFPRRLIRYAQLGLKEPLLSSKELWLCYYCGECTQTCPQQADPGEFMAAARRYAIARYDVTGLSKFLYRSGWFNVLFTIALTLFFSLFMLTFRQPASSDHLALFEFIPEVYIQVVGISLFVLVALVTLLGLVRMVRSVVAQGGLAFRVGEHPRLNWWEALWKTVAVEFLGQKRFRHVDCEEQPATPWVLRNWVVHASILYGFLGLFTATALDFLFKPVGSAVPLYYPMRLLGMLAGLLLMYGTTVAFIKRFRKQDRHSRNSQASDWMTLVLLWLIGLSGFLLEIAVYALLPAAWGYGLLIFHIALAMYLLVLLPVGKLAHVLYRTLAIFLNNLKPVPQTEESKLVAAEK
jgi:ferredoxin/nitrate reductase gamma subunit